MNSPVLRLLDEAKLAQVAAEKASSEATIRLKNVEVKEHHLTQHFADVRRELQDREEDILKQEKLLQERRLSLQKAEASFMDECYHRNLKLETREKEQDQEDKDLKQLRAEANQIAKESLASKTQYDQMIERLREIIR